MPDMPPFDVLIEPAGWPIILPKPFGSILPRLPLPLPVALPVASPAAVGGAGERAAVVVNFVASVDGAIRRSDAQPHPSQVSFDSPHDRFMLAIVRALASVVVIGAGPMRYYRLRQDAPAVMPQWRAEIRALRAGLGLGELHHVVVTASGDLPERNPIWDGPATVLTTPAGAQRLTGRLPEAVTIQVAAADSERIAVADVLAAAHRLAPPRRVDGSPGLLLVEPGPALFADLLGVGLIDELFLTTSPLLAGRGSGRLGLVEGEVSRRLELAGLARAGSYLFTRWRPLGPA